jgi:hypothetical protein
MAIDPGKSIVENPFYVLAVPPTCDRSQFEREGLRWLALLELGQVEAVTYLTPLGPRPRTPELVRWAMAELREPRQRLLHELWAQAPATTGPVASPPAPQPAPSHFAPWPDALRAAGWEA